MTKISDLSTLANINAGTVWPVVDANTTKKVSFATVKSAIQTPATANTLGAVKIGAGITVDSEGKISVSGNISVASNTVLGGVKIANDSNLTINPTGFLDLNKEITLRGSKIDGKTTEGHLDITADGLITISPGIGTIELFSGNQFLNSSIRITPNGIETTGEVSGLFNGTLNGAVDGYLIGNIYAPGYDGSQQPIFVAQQQSIKLKNIISEEGLEIYSSDILVDSPVYFQQKIRLARYTTEQRDAITSWSDGDLIFNINTDTVQVRISTGGWANLN